jgi:8-oxo-dGTP diphosphatase
MYVSVDCVLFGYKKEISVFLIRRTNPYFKNQWSLPGSIIFEDESLESAAKRTVSELFGLTDLRLMQVQAFGDPERTSGKPRILTVAYLSLLDRSQLDLELKVKNRTFISQTNEEEIILEGKWFSAEKVKELPQDHLQIVHRAHNRLKEIFENSSRGLALLPERFTMRELQKLHECIFGQQYDASNFRKKMKKDHRLKEWVQKDKNGRLKKTKLYSLE